MQSPWEPPYLFISGLLTTPTIWSLTKPLFPHALLFFAPLDKQTIQEQALELHAYLLKHGISKCHLIGHSMGGAIALEYTLTHKERVKSLTLCNSFAKLEKKERWLIYLNLVGVLLHIPRKWIIKGSLPLLFSKKASSYIKQLYETMTAQVPKNYFKTQLRACLSFDREKNLAEVKVPTYIIMSHKDQLLSGKHSQTLSQGIPGATLIQLPSEGHTPQLEAPQAFVKEILRPKEPLSPVP